MSRRRWMKRLQWSERDCRRLENLQSGHCSNAIKQRNAVLSSASFMNGAETKRRISAFCINSPSCCRPALVAARPLSALQFSVQEQTKRQCLFLLQLFLLLLLFLIIPPVCATQLYGNEAAASCLNAILKEFIDFQSEEHCAYLLQVPVALHRLRQFSLESG